VISYTHVLSSQIERFRAKGMDALAGFLADLTLRFKDAYDDAHPANWMFRADGALILIDPFSSGSSVSYDRRRGTREFQLCMQL
jgi:hypothetical protein